MAAPDDRGEGPAGPAVGADVDGPSRRLRWFGGCLLAALVLPGLAGLELWPLTGWKMFSLPRGDTGTAWVLQGVDVTGDTRLVDLEELPVAYSNAEWQLREVGSASGPRREDICRALADAVAEADPTIVELHIARDDRRLVEEEGGWDVEHDLEVHHTCEADGNDAGEGL